MTSRTAVLYLPLSSYCHCRLCFFIFFIIVIRPFLHFLNKRPVVCRPLQDVGGFPRHGAEERTRAQGAEGGRLGQHHLRLRGQEPNRDRQGPDHAHRQR